MYIDIYVYPYLYHCLDLHLYLYDGFDLYQCICLYFWGIWSSPSLALHLHMHLCVCNRLHIYLYLLIILWVYYMFIFDRRLHLYVEITTYLDLDFCVHAFPELIRNLTFTVFFLSLYFVFISCLYRFREVHLRIYQYLEAPCTPVKGEMIPFVFFLEGGREQTNPGLIRASGVWAVGA